MANQPAPQAQAAQIPLDQFIEVATRAALRVLAEHGATAQGLQPQAASAAQPQALAATFRPGGRVTTGIVFELQ